MALKITKMQPPRIELGSTGEWGALPQVSAAGLGFDSFIITNKNIYYVFDVL
jgi:hypothetical protein